MKAEELKERLKRLPFMAAIYRAKLNPHHPSNPLTGETTIKNSQQR